MVVNREEREKERKSKGEYATLWKLRYPLEITPKFGSRYQMILSVRYGASEIYSNSYNSYNICILSNKFNLGKKIKEKQKVTQKKKHR